MTSCKLQAIERTDKGRCEPTSDESASKIDVEQLDKSEADVFLDPDGG